MDIDSLRKFCLAFPYTSEKVQWGDNLCFKVDGKLFVVTALEHGPVRLSFKCTPEGFAELCERDGVIPAPYMARAQWVALEQLNTLPDIELRECIAESYRLVWERLPMKRRAELDGQSTTTRHNRAPVNKPKPKYTKARSAKPRSRG